MLRKIKTCNLLVVSLFISCLLAFGEVHAQKINVVFIGNSITHGAGLGNPVTDAPPVQACAYLKSLSKDSVNFSNQGVSGFTTLDFLPGTKAFANVIRAADSFYILNNALVFSIVLGTNDSAEEGPNGSPVSAADYKKNVLLIVDSLLKRYDGCKIVIHHPIWYSPNTQNRSRYLAAGLERLQTYFPQINAVVKQYKKSKPARVYLGDTQGFTFFKKHYLLYLQHEQGKNGVFYLHPNKEGASILGKFWGKRIAHALRIG